MQKPQPKHEAVIIEDRARLEFYARPRRAEEAQEFGLVIQPARPNKLYTLVLDQCYDEDEVRAWLERPADTLTSVEAPAGTKTIYAHGKPDLDRITKEAPEGCLAIFVTVRNNKGRDNFLTLIRSSFLDTFSVSDEVIVGSPLTHDWGTHYIKIVPTCGGLGFRHGIDDGPIYDWQGEIWDQEAEESVREEVEAALRWHRTEEYTAEYVAGDKNG